VLAAGALADRDQFAAALARRDVEHFDWFADDGPWDRE
jgi:hypothetical protein